MLQTVLLMMLEIEDMKQTMADADCLEFISVSSGFTRGVFASAYINREKLCRIITNKPSTVAERQIAPREPRGETIMITASR